ncbi:RNA polymerase sigma factor [Amycolatopsis sp. H20-H5]|uniref:RNA polymerase sigma factor n=1 Tax=Amycolatopsis sp. H20-H5 TaxID=3046309 RepID=UPI002DB9A6AE|nr:sigma-70 family RNA polymerase sigma factor [Amycolatopsis sp. H20-H5]MEC3975204.1 sigma-70 family RNA polymerase sigma factor [Amycolatopsis sp. H20-H5]
MADRQEFAGIARERASAWRRTAFLMCGDWAAAEDIVQVTLVRLYKQWNRLDAAGIDAYTRRVMSRLAIDEARRPHRRAEVLIPPPEHPVPAVCSADGIDVRAALDRLAPRQRAVLVLRFYCDLTVSQTAVALRITEGTVKSQTARALTTLRASLPAASVSTPTTERLLP